MGKSNPWTITVEDPRIDWNEIKDKIDLAAVVTRHLGPALKRRGRRLYWRCPFHEDRDPSFVVDPTKQRWDCYPCGIGGDAAAFAMKHGSMSFPEAVTYLAGGSSPTRPPMPRPRPPAKPPADAKVEPEEMSEADALALVEAAAGRLWTPEGSDALAYLTGRGLTPETIRAARLGSCPPLDRPGQPRGIVIPWFDGDRLTLVKIRQPEGRKPKYYEMFRSPGTRSDPSGARSPGIYPGRRVIRPGRPLVIVEGEFDCLLVGQELADLAAVVTLGSASARPGPGILGPLLAAAPWYIATDADEAGDVAASGWPARARRVRPPMLRPHPLDRVEKPKADWTDLYRHGVNLRRWWSDRLGGIEAPPLFTWEELTLLRWGPAADDPTPGLIVDKPDRGRMLAALKAAVQAEADPCGLNTCSMDNEGDGGGVAGTHTRPLGPTLS
jgi:DNA primase